MMNEPILESWMKMPRGVRQAVAAIVFAFGSYYFGLLLVAAFGVWSNRLTMTTDILVEGGILMVINMLALLARRRAPWVVLGFLGLYFSYLALHYGKDPSQFNWKSKWPEIVQPTLALGLDASLLHRFLRKLTAEV